MPLSAPHDEHATQKALPDAKPSLTETYRQKHQHPLNQLTHMIGIPMLFVSVLYPLFAWFMWGRFEWQALLILGGLGWGLQFLGHAIEGNRPAFMEDPRHFFVGPLVILYKPISRLLGKAKD